MNPRTLFPILLLALCSCGSLPPTGGTGNFNYDYIHVGMSTGIGTDSGSGSFGDSSSVGAQKDMGDGLLIDGVVIATDYDSGSKVTAASASIGNIIASPSSDKSDWVVSAGLDYADTTSSGSDSDSILGCHVDVKLRSLHSTTLESAVGLCYRTWEGDFFLDGTVGYCDFVFSEYLGVRPVVELGSNFRGAEYGWFGFQWDY